MGQKFLFGLLFLSLIFACSLTGSQAEYVVPDVNNLPPKVVFKGLDFYLQGTGYSADRVNDSLTMLKYLVFKPDVDKSTKEAAWLVLTMPHIRDHEECNEVANLVVSLATIATHPDNGSLLYDDEQHMETSHLANIVNQLTKEILATCEPYVERKLIEDIGQICPIEYQKYKQIFSKNFIDQYDRQCSPDSDPKLGALGRDLYSHGKDFNRVPYVHLIDRLFEVAGGDLEAQGAQRVQINHKNTTLNWFKVSQAKIFELVRNYILDPCVAYARQTKSSLLGLYHTGARFYGASPNAFDFNRFLANRTNGFKYELFRHEFCHKYGFEPLWSHAWEQYKQITA